MYSITLIYIKKKIKENRYNEINVYTKDFIEIYKCVSREVDKDYSLKELLIETTKDYNKNIKTKTYKKQ